MKKIMGYIYIIFGILTIGTLVYKIFNRIIGDYFIGNNPTITKAIIINDKNFLPHSYVTYPFSYSYQFKIDGKSYENNFHDTTLKIGDTIEVEYYRKWPSFNRALHPKE